MYSQQQKRGNLFSVTGCVWWIFLYSARFSSMGMGKAGKSAKKSTFPEIGLVIALLTYLSYAVLIGVRCLQMPYVCLLMILIDWTYSWFLWKRVWIFTLHSIPTQTRILSFAQILGKLLHSSFVPSYPGLLGSSYLLCSCIAHRCDGQKLKGWQCDSDCQWQDHQLPELGIL